MSEIKLKSGSQNIAVTLIKPEGFKKPLPGLILVHGWQSDQTGNAKRALEISKLGFVCLTLDLRGHGKSFGDNDKFSRKDHIEDIKAAYKYLTGLKEVNPERIGILGSSYGGYLSATVTNYLSFEWLILRAPALYYDKEFDLPTATIIKNNPQAFKSHNLTQKNCLALKGVANFSGEILLVESEKDMIVPHPVMENYLANIDKRQVLHKVIKEAPHVFANQKQEKEYLDILKNWLKEKSDELEVEV